MSLLSTGLVFSAALQSIGGVLSVEEVVPPAEAAGVVSDELLMVKIVVVGTGPERQEVVKTPREFVTAVGINGLEQTQDNPNVHGEDVKVSGESTPEDGATDGTKAQEHHFNRRRVFGSQTERSGVLVMNLMDSLVEGAPVKSAVQEVVPSILHDEENCNLVGHGPEGGEGDRSLQTTELSHWVEQPIKELAMMVPNSSERG